MAAQPRMRLSKTRFAYATEARCTCAATLSCAWPTASVVRDTRMALCRCGASQNKPFCDNSHVHGGFSDTGALGENKVRLLDTVQTGGKLIVTPTPNGSIKVEGDLALSGADGQTTFEGNRAFLCRCGGSHNKPFCDSTHKEIGFQAEGL